ncbi:response regulator [Dyadobacter luteus]|uniref:Response regulator n=1 Tax=Dyadobacter luteus TaxID=2259619 RepID=A0A3D8YFD8_9BACT|nr:response regulator [Dyadobacter luteus]REA63030.1 response regulator [Dyadobacter luteus]
MKIAIIDDDPIFQILLNKLIQKIPSDNVVQQYTNGRIAAEFIEEFSESVNVLPELIFLDINMPEMNGWQFLEALRTLSIKDYNPVIYLSSSSLDDKDYIRAKSFTELKGFLNKPISFPELSHILESFQ